jgi:hypothetical protein
MLTAARPGCAVLQVVCPAPLLELVRASYRWIENDPCETGERGAARPRLARRRWLRIGRSVLGRPRLLQDLLELVEPLVERAFRRDPGAVDQEICHLPLEHGRQGGAAIGQRGRAPAGRLGRIWQRQADPCLFSEKAALPGDLVEGSLRRAPGPGPDAGGGQLLPGLLLPLIEGGDRRASCSRSCSTRQAAT